MPSEKAAYRDRISASGVGASDSPRWNERQHDAYRSPEWQGQSRGEEGAMGVHRFSIVVTIPLQLAAFCSKVSIKKSITALTRATRIMSGCATRKMGRSPSNRGVSRRSV